MDETSVRPMTALVTGANRGLGFAVAARLHAEGLRVVVGARTEEAARRAADSIGAGVGAVGLDVTSTQDAKAARERIGPVEVLVNNAGVMLDFGERPSTVPLDLVETQLATNLLGSWRVTQAFLPDMVAGGYGRVVLVSSGTSTFHNGVFPGAPGYSVSKTGINALTVMLAAETEGSGVLVNAVNPGLVRTRMVPHAPTPPEEAAADVAWVARLPGGAPSGKLFRSRSVIPW